MNRKTVAIILMIVGGAIFLGILLFVLDRATSTEPDGLGTWIFAILGFLLSAATGLKGWRDFNKKETPASTTTIMAGNDNQVATGEKARIIKAQEYREQNIQHYYEAPKANALNGGQAVSIGGNNFAPIVQETGNKEIRPDLTKLTQIRESGYLLRNKGMQLEDERLLSSWIEDFESWNTEMLQALGELDKDKARILKVLGNIQRGTMYYPYIFGEVHALKLDVFTEKLIRLDKIIDDFLKLPIASTRAIGTSFVKESSTSLKDFSDFSVQLDKLFRDKNISGIGLGFLAEIKLAPPFLGINHTKPIISKSHERTLTEFFHARIYMEKNRDFIRGGNYTIRDGENHRKIIAQKVYGHERYAAWVPERHSYPTGLILELPYLNLNSSDDPYFIKRQISLSEDTEKIISLLHSYDLPEYEALPVLRMIYDAAQRTLDERKKNQGSI